MDIASLTTVNLLLLSSKHNKSAGLPPPASKLANFTLKQHMKQITGPDSDTYIDLLLPRKVEQSIST